MEITIILLCLAILVTGGTQLYLHKLLTRLSNKVSVLQSNNTYETFLSQEYSRLQGKLTDLRKENKSLVSQILDLEANPPGQSKSELIEEWVEWANRCGSFIFLNEAEFAPFGQDGVLGALSGAKEPEPEEVEQPEAASAACECECDPVDELEPIGAKIPYQYRTGWQPGQYTLLLFAPDHQTHLQTWYFKDSEELFRESLYIDACAVMREQARKAE